MFTSSYSFVLALGATSAIGLSLAAGGDSRRPGSIATPAPLFAYAAQQRRMLAAGAEKPAGTQVVIDNFTYSPREIVVSVGTEVTWTNKDDVPHTVTSNDHLFNSGALDTDGKFSYVFSKPGTYPYFCAVHPHMTAKVVVK